MVLVQVWDFWARWWWGLRGRWGSWGVWVGGGGGGGGVGVDVDVEAGWWGMDGGVRLWLWSFAAGG